MNLFCGVNTEMHDTCEEYVLKLVQLLYSVINDQYLIFVVRVSNKMNIERGVTKR